jgi:hypothetical protein
MSTDIPQCLQKTQLPLPWRWDPSIPDQPDGRRTLAVRYGSMSPGHEAHVSKPTLPALETHSILPGYKVELTQSVDDQSDSATDIERRGR